MCLVIDPLTPTILYAGTWEGGVFRSTNSGTSWTATGLTDEYVYAVAIDPKTPTILYAGTDGDGVFRSSNSGTTWTPVNDNLTYPWVWSLAIDPKTPTTLYAGTNGDGVFRSTNSGTSWTAVNTDMTGLQVNSIAIDPVTTSTMYAGTWGEGVYRSINNGTSWTAVNTNLTDPLTPAYINSLVISPVSTTLYAGTAVRGVFRFTDSGDYWTEMNTGLTNLDVCLAINPVTTAILYAGTWGDGVYCSTNSGGYWSAMNTGLTNAYVQCLAIDPSAATLYAAASTYNGNTGGLFRYDAASHSLVLSSSWNLVSVAVPLPASSIPGLQAVYGYHNGWSVPTTLTPGEAYWVQVQNAVTVTLPGTPSTTPVLLTYQAGWQLLGNPYDVPLPISSITNHTLITTCYSYGPSWGVLNLATDSLQPGKGYWIYLSAATTLTLIHP
jgi:hypothetical protein